MDRLGELGIDVPAAVSVAGFDDIPMAARIAPSLSTVRLPLREIGHRGFEAVDRQLAGKEAPTETLPFEVVLRNSTAPPPTQPLSRPS
jgi:LacI family transcriptional regulator